MMVGCYRLVYVSRSEREGEVREREGEVREREGCVRERGGVREK